MFDFGNNLRKIRKEMKINQKTLANRIGISISMISRYENGEIYPPFETLIALSRIMNVSLDELCGTQTKGTNALYGLTDNQADIIKKLTTEFRNHNIAVRKNITQEQYELIGQIVVELSK